MSAPPSPNSTAPDREVRRGWLLPLVLAVVAGLALLPGLGATGLWTEGELPVLDRSLASLGEPRSDMLRSPWLPDQLRTWSYAALGRADFGLRLPGALAGLGLVVLAGLSARRIGWSPAWAGLAAGFALAMPLLLASSRTVLGNPVGELCFCLATLAWIAAVDRGRPRTVGSRLGLAAVASLALAGAVASMGVLLGAALPLALVALAANDRPAAGESSPPDDAPLALPRLAVVLFTAAAVAATGIGLWLAAGQGEGYIPLLGAAVDLELKAEPTGRPFTASLESYGYQVYPLLGLVTAGLFTPGRARWFALWLGLILLAGSLWSQRYGPTVLPLTLPSALLATAACRRMLDPREPIAARRLVLIVALVGALILAKDAGRLPARVASPLLTFAELQFPSDHLELDARVPRLAKAFAALLLLAHLAAPLSPDQRAWRASLPARLRERWATRATIADRLLTASHPELGLERARAGLAWAVLALALALQVFAYGHRLLPDVGAQMSVVEPLRRFASLVDDDTIPEPRLGLHRVREPGLAYYGPRLGLDPDRPFLPSRPDLEAWLYPREDEAAGFPPRAALIRRGDLPAVSNIALRREAELTVVDASHHRYLLIANVSPPGVVDQSPLAQVRHTQAPALAHDTYLAWDPYVELIAWEIEGELHRGSTATLHLVFRVLRPLPAGTKMYARLQRGRMSRVGAQPHELTGGVLPPNYWRAGDFIHHRYELEVPWLEVLPGEHELIVGMRRSEKTNHKITKPTPEDDAPAHGVRLRGKKQEFAIIGTAEIAW